MKKIFFLLAILPSLANAKNITLDSLHHEFERYLTGPKQPSITIENHTYEIVELKFEPDSGTLLYGFSADNRPILDYLGMNYNSLKDEYLFWHKDDSARFPKMLADSQWRNLYFERIIQLLARYLDAKQHLTVEGLVFNSKPKLTENFLQAFAAKFYYPDSIQPDGGIRTHICIAFNGYRDAAPPRNLMLEAVAYSIVNEHILIPADPISDELGNAIKAAGLLNLSDDRAVKLLRAQGVVWGIMSQSPFLEKAIRDMYAAKKSWLTFELTD